MLRGPCKGTLSLLYCNTKGVLSEGELTLLWQLFALQACWVIEDNLLLHLCGVLAHSHGNLLYNLDVADKLIVGAIENLSDPNMPQSTQELQMWGVSKKGGFRLNS